MVTQEAYLRYFETPRLGVTIYTTAKAEPPAFASSSTTSVRPEADGMSPTFSQDGRNSYLPMTSKNALGSIPLAEEKSVPVFFRDCIAVRTA